MSIYNEFKGTLWAVAIIDFITVVYLNVGYTKYDESSMDTFESAFESQYDLNRVNPGIEGSSRETISGSSVRARIYNVTGFDQEAGLLIGATSSSHVAEAYVLSSMNERTDGAKLDNRTYAFERSEAYLERYPEHSEAGYHTVSTYKDGVVAEVILTDPVGLDEARSIAFDLQDSLGYALRQADPPGLAVKPLFVDFFADNNHVSENDFNESLRNKTY